MSEPHRDFKGVWIPKAIWLNAELTLQEKVFLVEISSLDNDQGCFASNAYFAEFFGLSTVRVSEVINSLVRKKYLSSEIDQVNGNRRILRTLLKESLRPSQRNVYDPIKDSFIHNNTINNTTNTTEQPRGSREQKQEQNNTSLPLLPGRIPEINIWLDAVASRVGAKDRLSLPKRAKWESVCTVAIREQYDLLKFLAAVDQEKVRTKGQEQFFSPDTVLQVLQLAGQKAKPQKWAHAI